MLVDNFAHVNGVIAVLSGIFKMEVHRFLLLWETKWLKFQNRYVSCDFSEDEGQKTLKHVRFVYANKCVVKFFPAIIFLFDW